MNYTMNIAGSTANIKASGALTFDDHNTIKRLIEEVGDHSVNAVVIDMQDIPAIDSAGIGLLLLAHDKLQQKGQELTLSKPQAAARKIIELGKVHDLVKVEFY